MSTPHKTTSKHPRKWTKEGSKSLLTGSIIALFIAASPYIFYSYKSFPDIKIWETFLFTYKSSYYEAVTVTVWTAMGKFIPLFLLIIWFFTCRHWWYHVILIPIGMFLFQLINVLNDDLIFFDVVELWYLLPIMAVIVPLVYLTRAKLFHNMHAVDNATFEEELKVNRNLFQQIRDLFR